MGKQSGKGQKRKTDDGHYPLVDKNGLDDKDVFLTAAMFKRKAVVEKKDLSKTATAFAAAITNADVPEPVAVAKTNADMPEPTDVGKTDVEMTESSGASASVDMPTASGDDIGMPNQSLLSAAPQFVQGNTSMAKILEDEDEDGDAEVTLDAEAEKRFIESVRTGSVASGSILSVDKHPTPAQVLGTHSTKGQKPRLNPNLLAHLNNIMNLFKVYIQNQGAQSNQSLSMLLMVMIEVIYLPEFKLSNQLINELDAHEFKFHLCLLAAKYKAIEFAYRDADNKSIFFFYFKAKRIIKSLEAILDKTKPKSDQQKTQLNSIKSLKHQLHEKIVSFNRIPEKVDIDIFIGELTKIIESLTLKISKRNQDGAAEYFIYSFFKLVSECVNEVSKKLPLRIEVMHMPHSAHASNHINDTKRLGAFLRWLRNSVLTEGEKAYKNSLPSDFGRSGVMMTQGTLDPRYAGLNSLDRFCSTGGSIATWNRELQNVARAYKHLAVFKEAMAPQSPARRPSIASSAGHSSFLMRQSSQGSLGAGSAVVATPR